MGDALRAALNEGLSEALDKELATGTEGLFTGTKLSNNAAAAITTFADYVSDFAHGRVRWPVRAARVGSARTGRERHVRAYGERLPRDGISGKRARTDHERGG